MVPADIPAQSFRRQIATFTRLVVLAAVIVGTQTRLESVRWWWSPPIVSALAITQGQSAAIERLYQDSLPTRQHASEDVIGLTDDIVTRLRDGQYDDELLHVTERLAGARLRQCELRRSGLERAVQLLTPHQREQLTRLIAEKLIVE